MKNFIFIILISCLFIGCEEYDGEDSSPSQDGAYTEMSPGSQNPGSNEGNVNGEQYNEIQENAFISTTNQAVSTFSVDADGASYANVRRFLEFGNFPPRNAVRTEELINYFSFDYPQSSDEHPIALNGEISSCPWKEEHKLVRIGIQGKELTQKPASNFVLLIDVSGSMGSPDKLKLFKKTLLEFTDQMSQDDRNGIVTYAGQSGVALHSTSGADKDKIRSAIKKLGSGGSTAGAEGIKDAYQMAEENFIEGGNNRVILGTDGDFNVGISSQEKLIELIENKRESGVFLTVCGLGTGNYQEGKMEQLANHGNGTFEYIDKLSEGRKVFIHNRNEFYTIAKDVKVQVTFDSTQIESYRLIGYANRILNEEDFDNDTIDAGEIGASQSITALYQVIPHEQTSNSKAFTIDFRYKNPQDDISRKISLDIQDEETSFMNASENMRFAASVAGYGMLLIDSDYKGNVSYQDVSNWARNAKSYDPYGYRSSFLELIDLAEKY